MAELPASIVARGRTAIARVDLSRPVSLALSSGVIRAETDVFDYGCGRGTDVAALAAQGVAASGWDPVHFPKNPRRPSAVVNFGYVANVIEDPSERDRALADAWQLTRRTLIVAARLDWEPSAKAGQRSGDGVITSRGTFQKYFTHEELHSWVSATLAVDGVTAAPGVLFVFREEAERQAFGAARFAPARPRPRVNLSEVLEAHRSVLEPLNNFLAEHGRAPDDSELSNKSDVVAVFGTTRNAYRLLSKVLGTADWERAAVSKQRDLLVYVALSRFGRRPALSNLPDSLQRDIKGLFGSYSAVCRIGDSLLFSAGQKSAIDSECKQSTIGKLTPDSLYVHVSAVHLLSPLLRVYEGCARTLTGAVEGATLVKLRRDKPKVSYLVYPEFDTEGHPELAETYVADLKRLWLDHREYRTSANRPVLHRKETFVGPDYPLRSLFEALTTREEAAGLLESPELIGFADKWNARLLAGGFTVTGHTLRPI